MDFSNLTKFWKAKFLLVFVFSLFYSADLMAQSELRFERVVNLTKLNQHCYGGTAVVYDTVPSGKIWKLEAISASCMGGRRPLVYLNGSRIALSQSDDMSSRTYFGNPIWLKENSIIGSHSDNPGGGSGCFDCNYFYSILEFSQTP
jgi:hypothetical protein